VNADSYASLARLDLAGEKVRVHRLDAVPGSERLPLSHKILLETCCATTTATT
jgi:hypothetical protein